MLKLKFSEKDSIAETTIASLNKKLKYLILKSQIGNFIKRKTVRGNQY